MNPTQIKAVLAEMGGKANKALGQHFLIDQSVLDSIVRAADLCEKDWVLEVGPGLGVLTMAMLGRGANVIAIEQDRRFLDLLRGRADKLQTTPSADRIGELNLVHGDAAQLDWEFLIGAGLWKFVSNLPYSITSLAIRKALYCSNPPEKVVVLIQKEVAERAISVAHMQGKKMIGKTSLLSLMIALASSSARIVKRVPSGAFFPPPKVQSAVLEIVPLSQAERVEKWGMDPERMMEVAKQGFAHPRKKVRSNLAGFSFTENDFEQAGISENARAEDLMPEQWAKLVQNM